MKFIVPVVLVVVTVALMVVALTTTGNAAGTVGIAAGAPFLGLTPPASTPEQAVTNYLIEVKRRNWDRALGDVATANANDEQDFIQDWTGAHGSLRSFSNLESFDIRPLHATGSEAQERVQLHWSTPVGPIDDVRDLQVQRQGDAWKVIWPKPEMASVPAQVVPVTYLRWDLVAGGAEDEWGSKNVDAPHVRIVSMFAVNTAAGAVVMGEAVNEDTIPAFVNVNATLVDGAGNAIDEESSFDKIAHVLLPKQVTPYRIDFPHYDLSNVKNVRMDIRATLVPASADPVIEVMNQKMAADVSGKALLQGDLRNDSGQTVNIPHLIASFYDGNGKVVWVADGYVDRALLPQSSEPFAVEIPKALASKVQNFHVVVNQYSLGNRS